VCVIIVQYVFDEWKCVYKVYFFSDDFIGCYSASLPKKTDEQSALNRILQETAA
jgi:hypothetical protein